jgi:hypothetical protein
LLLWGTHQPLRRPPFVSGWDIWQRLKVVSTTTMTTQGRAPFGVVWEWHWHQQSLTNAHQVKEISQEGITTMLNHGTVWLVLMADGMGEVMLHAWWQQCVCCTLPHFSGPESWLKLL